VATSVRTNAELAQRFDLLADLLELDGADRFRLQAYRRAAQRIRDAAVSVAELALDGRAQRLDGIGPTIEAKIVELATTGDLAALAKARNRVPEGLVEVMHVPGLGPKTAMRLWRELGVSSAAELRAAAESGRLRDLSGLGAKTERNVLAHLSRPRPAAQTGRVLLGKALPLVEAVVRSLAAHPACDRVSEAGSVRRRAETVKDVDVIATSAAPADLIGHFVGLPIVADLIARGDTKATVVAQDGLRIDLRVVPPECFGNLLQHFTGSKDHNVALREDAVRRGLSISEWGVAVEETGVTVTHESEEELYRFLGYDWIPPELRENAGELEAARHGGLPVLVEAADVRGDLHCHTTWSDGKATVHEMARGAQARGLDYLAICDHARRLRGGLLEQQAAEIRGAAADVGIEVLRGVEADIRADGTLDTPDEVLATLDWVVASVHSGFGDDADALTGRIVAAIENPHVDCIGHLTGRKLGRRSAYELDLEAVFAAAARTGTCLEINGQPDRLDLRDTHARAAARAGVPIVVSSDAHSVDALGYTAFAVAQARRAWLTAGDVVNTRPWSEVLA
jgi:DNA polymerase (family 10)